MTPRPRGGGGAGGEPELVRYRPRLGFKRYFLYRSQRKQIAMKLKKSKMSHAPSPHPFGQPKRDMQNFLSQLHVTFLTFLLPSMISLQLLLYFKKAS